MGRAAGIYPDEHIFAMLKAGSATPCFDGQNFFDVAHPVYADVAGTGKAEAATNLLAPDADPGPAWYFC